MKLRNKIASGVIAAVLALGIGAAAAPAANAVSGNKIQNVADRCTTFVPDGYSTATKWTICGNNNYAYNVQYVVVKRGTCLQMGFWSFTTYCATGKVDRLISAPGGTTYIR